MFASKNKEFIRTRITLFSLLQSGVVLGKPGITQFAGVETIVLTLKARL